VEDVAANHEIEAAARHTQLKNALILKTQSQRESRVAGASQIEVLLDDVNTKDLRSWKKFRQS